MSQFPITDISVKENGVVPYRVLFLTVFNEC